MLEPSLQTVVENIGIFGLSVVALVIAYKKIFKDWSSTGAETTVIQLMQSELERMSEQNTALSSEIGKLHSEVINLSAQLRKLSSENQRLQEEVVALTSEISSLRKMTGKGTQWQDHV